MTSTADSWPPLIQDLVKPGAYAHPISEVTVRETHISWVLLTGEFAYKVKKPVNLGFVDFTTLEKRRHYCEEERRLNQRFTTDLYLDVVPITQEAGHFRFYGDGPAQDYAVRMRQFDEEMLAGTLLAAGQLRAEEISALARKVALMHEDAERSGAQDWGSAERIRNPAEQNFAELMPLLETAERRSQLEQLQRWSEGQCRELVEVFEQRRQAGFVRECHGDLHLGNIARWQGELTPFDCIEFNPAFRWVDVISEAAFLMMDLYDHQHSELGWRFLNAYLEQTGDYAGLGVLRFYLVYFALVRAKVTALRRHQPSVSANDRERLTEECHSYLDLAHDYTLTTPPWLMITHGLSGSGKTYGSQSLVEQHQAIRIRSDVERKRLFGLASSDRAIDEVDVGLYTSHAGKLTYDRLASLAEDIVKAGYPVVVDATFLKERQRRTFRELADRLGVPFHILTFDADHEVLRDRITKRLLTGDASDATLEVLNHQIQSHEPLLPEEEEHVFITS